MKKINKLKVIIVILIIILLILFNIGIFYFNNYYHAEYIAYDYLISIDTVNVSKIDEGYFFDGPGTEEAIIFYPGAKVEVESYARLMYTFAENGIDTFLIEMPLNFALLNKNKADRIIEKYNYNLYSLAGHSLGGVAASMYLNKSNYNFKSLILIGSYPAAEVPDNTKVYFVYGENDTILNKEKLEKSKKYINSENYLELEIKGANHSSFGDYGTQKGDGTLIQTKDDVINELIRYYQNN